ncbi:unnamed protein product [Cyclocybe aegerita]|uniref:Uncharacterized protein n=1 Tax=Cyclocybe aegerita TaxID=1973307 RepID=A0A8S0XQ87_CYCAE|nr:unnamed protein product [Cyclocybe aegerita]
MAPARLGLMYVPVCLIDVLLLSSPLLSILSTLVVSSSADSLSIYSSTTFWKLFLERSSTLLALRMSIPLLLHVIDTHPPIFHWPPINLLEEPFVSSLVPPDTVVHAERSSVPFCWNRAHIFSHISSLPLVRVYALLVHMPLELEYWTTRTCTRQTRRLSEEQSACSDETANSLPADHTSFFYPPTGLPNHIHPHRTRRRPSPSYLEFDICTPPQPSPSHPSPLRVTPVLS